MLLYIYCINGVVSMSDDVVALGMKYFNKEGHNCAQTVMRTVLEHYGMDFKESTKAMAGLGGGVGLDGNVCGAVSGAVAALGVLNSRRFEDFEQHKNETYTSALKFMYKFRKKHETIICDELTGITMSDKDARTKAIDTGVFHRICPQFVEDAIRIVVEMEDKMGGVS